MVGGVELCALWNDIRGWYAPAMDTHRTPFGGRNYEYYSEDGVLAGQYAAAAIRSAKAGGIFFHIKHFALNDQDTNRGDRGNFRNADPYNGLCTYAGEQSIREIYLKPFELAITQGGSNGVMTAYNRIGDTWAGGHYGLLTEVLRNEWGMRGNVLTTTPEQSDISSRVNNQRFENGDSVTVRITMPAWKIALTFVWAVSALCFVLWCLRKRLFRCASK